MLILINNIFLLLQCGRKYTTYRKTCQVCKLLRCVTCKGLGHDKTQCPDLWRKYHMTVNFINFKIFLIYTIYLYIEL